jgi:hypothetical protein
VARKLDEKQILVEGNSVAGSSEFMLKAEKGGVLHYRITLTPVEKEASEVNNVKDVFIEVVEKKERFLYWPMHRIRILLR